MPTFDATNEAVQQDAAQWEPHNDAGQGSAQRMRLALEDVPLMVETVAGALRVIAAKTIDQVLLDPGGADLMNQVAENLQSQVDPLKEIAAQMDTLHDDRVRHMRSEDPRAGSWDWRTNQDEHLTGA